MAKKERILTGDTPTGKLHLGHWVGTLENRVQLQHQYDLFVISADLHALTTLKDDTARVRDSAREVLLDNLAVGLSPDSITYFMESDVPEIYELAAFFSMYVTHAEALRNPTIKDEIVAKKLGTRYSLGFINYPVYQAADILCVKASLVPVGKDQEAHIELAREIARTLNARIGSELFPEPQALIGRVGKLVGTDGNPKMSKSLGNTIFLSDTEEEVTRKVMGMYTDPARIHATDPGTVEGNPVFIYLDAFGTEAHRDQIEEYKVRYREGKVGDIEVKRFLAAVLNEFLAPVRVRRAEYAARPALLREILARGAARVRDETAKTLEELRRGLKLIPLM